MQIYKYSILILSFLLYCCSSHNTDTNAQEIRINNNHSAAIMIDIWDLESSNTVDPNPAVSIDKVSFLQVNPNQSATLSKSEIKGNSEAENIRLFLYEIKRDSAYYQSSFSLSFSQEINILHEADDYFIE